jgi:O-antigen/teichoic acid export membrane protein
VLLVASHFLPTQEYGLYIFLFSIGSALGLIAVLGQQILVVKHYRRTEATSHPLNQALVARQCALARCSAASRSLAAALPLWRSLPGPCRRPTTISGSRFVFAAIFALSEYLQNYFRIHGRINLSLVPREIVWRGSSILCIGAAGLAGVLMGGAGAMALVTGAARAATTIYQSAHLPPGRGGGLAAGRPPCAGGDPCATGAARAAISSPTTS